MSTINISGYEFERIDDLALLKEASGAIRQFMPQARYTNARNLPRHQYGSGPFCKFRIPKLYQVSGVYILRSGDELRYVGETENLSKRFNAGYGNISPKNCFKGGRETNCRLNNLIYSAAGSGETITLWFLRTTDYKGIEVNLRTRLNPPWNRA